MFRAGLGIILPRADFHPGVGNGLFFGWSASEHGQSREREIEERRERKKREEVFV